MPKEAKNRVLRKLMDGVYVYTTPEPSPELALGPYANEGWEIFTATSGAQYVVNRSYFDLEGYKQQEQSFFPTAPVIQDQGGWIATGSTGIVALDLITIKPIIDADLEKLDVGVSSLAVPGSNHSLHGLQEIILGSSALWEASVDINNAHKMTQKNYWGLSTATARDRIFITRIVMPPSPTGILIVPPSAWVIAGVSAEEKELVWMERLRRSYDVAQNV